MAQNIIVTQAAINRVIAATAAQFIRNSIADDAVIAIAAKDIFNPCQAVTAMRARTAAQAKVNRYGTGRTRIAGQIRIIAAKQRVIAKAAKQRVVAIVTQKTVIAIAAINAVIAGLAINGVIQRITVRTRRPGLIPRAKFRTDTAHYLNSPRHTGVISFHKRSGAIFANGCGMRDTVSLPCLSKIIFISKAIIGRKIY